MITFIMGPSCAGKTTTANQLRQKDDIIVDFDALAQALGSPKSHDHPQTVIDAVFALRTMLENKALNGETTTNVWAIRHWLSAERIKEFGEKGARFLVVDPGEEVALERAETDGRPEGTVERIKRWYEKPPEIPAEYLVTEEKGAAMKTKSFEIQVKEAPGEEAPAGVFTGYASIFNNIDSYGDMVIPGAFTESLKTFGPGGSNIPCYWGHDMADPMKCIGWTTSAEEDDRGLKVTVQLDLDNPNGAQAYKLIKAGVVNQMSFAYEIEEGAWVDTHDRSWYELRQLKIFEVSLVQVGANQATELLDVKDRLTSVKAGRKISATNEEKLTQAIALIGEVLESDTPEEGSSEEPKDSKAEERESAKAEDCLQAKARKLSPVEIAEYELDLL